MSFADSVTGYSPVLLAAVVHETPAVGAPVFVTIPSFGPHVFGPCPRAGWASPVAGDPCLVAKDELGGYWIVSF